MSDESKNCFPIRFKFTFCRRVPPIASGIARKLTKDTEIGGYHIPTGVGICYCSNLWITQLLISPSSTRYHRIKSPCITCTESRYKLDCIILQTFVFFGNNTLSMSEEQFENPEQFLPERWLQGINDPQKQRLMGLCVLPFGMGKRNCLGRRFAEQEIHLAVIKVHHIVFQTCSEFAPGCNSLLMQSHSVSSQEVSTSTPINNSMDTYNQIENSICYTFGTPY